MSDQALEDFMAHLFEATEKAKLLTEILEDHLGYNPDTINYGHVGDVQRINNMLGEILARHID